MLIAEFKDHIGLSRADVENWIGRLELATSYAPTRPGVARQFSRDNVLELAVLAAMTRAGCPPRTGAAYAAMVLRNERNGGLRQWLAFPAGDFTQGRGTDDPSGTDFAALAAQSSNRAVSLIHIGAILATVDKLFAEERAP